MFNPQSISVQCGPLDDSDDVADDDVKLETSLDNSDGLSQADDYATGTLEQRVLPVKVSALTDKTESYTGLPMAAVKQPLQDKPGTQVRIFFYKGIGLSNSRGTDYNYPQCSAHPTDFTNTLAGTDAVVDNFWKETLHWIKTRKQLRVEQDIPLAQLADFDWAGKVMYDRTKCVYEQISVTLTMQKIERADVTLWTTTP